VLPDCRDGAVRSSNETKSTGEHGGEKGDGGQQHIAKFGIIDARWK
jgi:hypothetical protein